MNLQLQLEDSPTFIATERTPRDFKLWIRFDRDVEAGAQVSILLGGYRSLLDKNPDKFRQWALSGASVEGAGGVEVTVRPPAAHHEISPRRQDIDGLNSHFETLPLSDAIQPGSYFYLRLLQDDGHRAWLSPVWLD